MKQKIAFAMIMGVITTGLISFILVYVNTGWTGDFFASWFRSWGLAYIVAVPAILIIAPRVQKWVDHLFKNQHTGHGFK